MYPVARGGLHLLHGVRHVFSLKLDHDNSAVLFLNHKVGGHLILAQTAIDLRNKKDLF